MLNWLKRRAKVSFHNRYTNILRRSNSPEMFLTEQSMLNQQPPQTESIKISVFSTEGEEYSLNVPFEMTLDRVKLMAIGHFYGPLEAVGSNSSPKLEGESSKASSPSNRYRLILAREYRILPEESSVSSEGLLDNDEIILVECRKRKNEEPLEEGALEDSAPTMEQIRRRTTHVPEKNWDRQAQPANPTLDFKVALRRILLTMMEASIHLIAPDPSAADQFALVFEHLEKRHKPRVDKASLKQLTEMGFSEARAIRALQLKRNVTEAMEWLLEDSSKQMIPGQEEEMESDVLLVPPERRHSFFLGGDDPAERVIREFNKYVEKWFVPDSRALQYLVSMGYCEEVAQKALRMTCNNEKLAEDFLEGNRAVAETLQRGFERDSPIMSAILDSPIVQVALSKPKTLFALMVLCETPSNVNVWMSDPETHPVVSQVLRIYHAEKHRLGIDSLSPPPSDIKMEETDRTSRNPEADTREESPATPRRSVPDESSSFSSASEGRDSNPPSPMSPRTSSNDREERAQSTTILDYKSDEVMEVEHEEDLC